MGQIVKRKKKGRPAKADPGGGRHAPPPEHDLRRSHRRRNVRYVFDLDDYFDDDELFDEALDGGDPRRREKKLNLLLKLQNNKDGGASELTPPSRTRHAPATSSDDDDKPSKKRRIGRSRDDDEIDDHDDDDDDENNDVNYRDRYNDEEVRETKQEDSPPGTPLENASGLRLPDKKTLELILDKLQKKDIYAVYAEPVDPEQLPDYHDVIEHPMDFATVRNKLGNGSYATLEQFESDVFLICSNAMKYNAPDTIYYKQARSIQELAKKKFQKIRNKFENSEQEVEPEQKNKISSIMKKQIKRSSSRTMQDPVASDFSSGAALATTGDLQTVPNVQHSGGLERPGGIEGLVEATLSLNDNNLDKGEESLSGKGPMSRIGRKSSINDENRRATYNISLAQPVTSSESIFSTFGSESKQLVPVGLYSDHSYARSLARFAATLGSVAWRIASKRIEQALPQGSKFGRGWVGEYEPLPSPVVMLENCSVKEPAFFTKVGPSFDPRKIEKPSAVSSSTKEQSSGTFSEKKFPLSGPSGMRPGAAPPFTSPPEMEHKVKGNSSEVKQSFSRKEQSSRLFSEKKLPFPGPAGMRPGAAAPTSTPEMDHKGSSSEVKQSFFTHSGTRSSTSGRPSYQYQNSQSSNNTKSEKLVKQVGLNSPTVSVPQPSSFISPKSTPRNSEMDKSRSRDSASNNINFLTSGSFKQLNANGVAIGGVPNGQIFGNNLDVSKVDFSSSSVAQVAAYNPHDQSQGLSDPVLLMRMLSEKARNQQMSLDQSSPNAPQVSSPAPSSNRDDSGNAAAAAARAWMSVGAGGFRSPGEIANPQKHQIYADSLYNPTRDLQPQVSRFRGEYPVPGMHLQQDKNSSLLNPFVSQIHQPTQIPQPMRVGNEMQFQNQQMALPLGFQLQSPWRSLSPQMHSRQKPDSLPPDLNIGFQSSGSPGRPSSGSLVDSQQPDLALQL